MFEKFLFYFEKFFLVIIFIIIFILSRTKFFENILPNPMSSISASNNNRKRRKRDSECSGQKVELKRGIRPSNWQNFKSVSSSTTRTPVKAPTLRPAPKMIISNLSTTAPPFTSRPVFNPVLPHSQRLHNPTNLPKGPLNIPFSSTRNLVANTNISILSRPDAIGMTGVCPRLERGDLCVGIDCEMVGIQSGKESMLARVSLVNSRGQCIYDTFVAPLVRIVDYRTAVSGVRPLDVQYGASFEMVQKIVAMLIHNRILVGHGLGHDLEMLGLTFPRRFIRDTASYKPFRILLKTNRSPSLKKLAKEILNIDIQGNEHSSIEDARAAMMLYNLHQENWERSCVRRLD